MDASTPKTADTSCFGTKYSFLIVKEVIHFRVHSTTLRVKGGILILEVKKEKTNTHVLCNHATQIGDISSSAPITSIKNKPITAVHGS